MRSERRTPQALGWLSRRSQLAIEQAELARRAGVSRQWIIAFEQGKPTLAVAKVLRTLETLDFELVLTPYGPAPPWMLRATAAAEARQKTLAGRRTRRNTRRARARDSDEACLSDV